MSKSSSGADGRAAATPGSVHPMFEFDSERVSSFDAASLSAKLTERSTDGWEVVAIVPAGSDVVAYLRRATDASDRSATADAAAASSDSPTAVTAAWEQDSRSGAAPGSTGGSSWGGAVAQQTSTPTVAAGWYADPAGRYELRYWDGTAWTEHVSRGGQQATDPPVA